MHASPEDNGDAGRIIAKQAGLSLGWSAAGSLLRFLAGVIIARFYSIEWLGIYAIASSIARITADFANLGLDQGLVRYVARLHAIGRTPQLVATVRQGVRYSLLASLGIAAAVWFGSDGIGRLFTGVDPSRLSWVVAGFAAAIPAMTLAQVFAATSQGFRELKQRTLALEVLPAFSLCLGLVLLHDRVPTPWAIALSFVISNAVSLVSAVMFVRRAIPLRWGPGARPEPGLLAYSLPLLLTSVVANLIRWGDVLLLGMFTSARVTGLYQIAARTAAVMSMITSSLAGILAPVVSGLHAQGRQIEIRKYLKLVTRWSVSFAWPAVLFFAVNAADFLFLVGSEFPEAGTALVVLALAHAFWAVAAGNMTVLTMTGYPRLNLFNMVATLALNVSANLVLIPRFGADGAALAMALAFGLWATLQTVEVRAIHRVSQFSSSLFKPVLAGIATVIVQVMVKTVVGGPPWAMFAVGVATFAIVYPGCLFLLGIEADDRKIFAALTGKPPAHEA